MSSDPETLGSWPKRVSRPMLFMGIAELYSKRSTCRRGSVGVVATRDGRIVAAGYNGATSGQDHCLEKGCILVDGHCVRAVHAEANLVAWAARIGTSLLGTGIYTTTQPCLSCSKLLVNAGVAWVVFGADYEGAGMELIENLDLEVRRYHATDA